MWTLIEWGGFPIWFVLAFGFIAFGSAVLFAWQPQRRGLRLIIGMSLATLFSILSAIAADLATVGHSVNVGWQKYMTDGGHDMVTRIINQGIAESLSPGIIGFTLLSLTWLVASVGLRRLPDAD
jgi:hypothetical protein